MLLPAFPSNRLIISLDIERQLGVAPPPLLREHPSATLWEAAKLLIQTHARRVPLLDTDTETGHEVVISVLTQYRLLKFISLNVSLGDCASGLWYWAVHVAMPLTRLVVRKGYSSTPPPAA